jgi:hypothetical protein
MKAKKITSVPANDTMKAYREYRGNETCIPDLFPRLSGYTHYIAANKDILI